LPASQIAFLVFEYAAALALDVSQFNRDTSEDRYAAQVGEGFFSGVRRGGNRTPMLCINRVRVELRPEAKMDPTGLERNSLSSDYSVASSWLLQ